MKKIPLTQNQIALVDNADFEWLNQWIWYAHKEKNTFYAFRTTDDMKMHRLIMNAQKGQQTDHKNHNGLDNQRHNLRFCNNTQNLQNAQKHKSYGKQTCSSKYKGVCWDKTKKKWQTNICINKNMLTIGRFNSEIEAAKTYDNAARKFFGEFACLNFTGERK